MTAGTWTIADSSSRTGRVTPRRITRRERASRQACGTGRVPTVLSLRVTSQPEASRIERIITPTSHATTIHGSAGSSSARMRAWSDGPGRAADGVTSSVPGGVATTRGAGATRAATHGASARSRTVVPTGAASMRIKVVTARA